MVVVVVMVMLLRLSMGRCGWRGGGGRRVVVERGRWMVVVEVLDVQLQRGTRSKSVKLIQRERKKEIVVLEQAGKLKETTSEEVKGKREGGNELQRTFPSDPHPSSPIVKLGGLALPVNICSLALVLSVPAR